MSEPYRLRYTNQIVGLFLLAVLVTTTVVSVVLFSRLFVTRDHFYVSATEDEASDLKTGTEVIYLGKTIGHVQELRYVATSDLVSVLLAIDSDYSDQITTDSQVVLNHKFGVGIPVLTIRRKKWTERTRPARPLQPGQSIGQFLGDPDPIGKMADEFESASSSMDLAAKTITHSMTESVDPAFNKSSTAFESWEKTSETLRPATLETLVQIRGTTARLEKELTKLTQRINELVDKDIRETVASIKESAIAATDAAKSVGQTASTIEAKSEQTNKDVAETLKTLRETALMIQRLTQETREVVRIVRSEANELPGTTERINDTVSDTQDLVGDIQNHWLLRRYRTDPKPTQQVSPSAVRGGGIR